MARAQIVGQLFNSFNSKTVHGNCFFIQYCLQSTSQCSHQSGGKMNQQQAEFIQGAIQQLKTVVEQCAENSATATAILGRRQVGRHIVVVKIIAELDEGFSAPLASHASRIGHNPKVGKSSQIEPDYSKKTEHHNKNNQTNRWHKPIFD